MFFRAFVLLGICTSALTAPQYYIQRPTSSHHSSISPIHIDAGLEIPSYHQQQHFRYEHHSPSVADSSSGYITSQSHHDLLGHLEGFGGSSNHHQHQNQNQHQHHHQQQSHQQISYAPISYQTEHKYHGAHHVLPPVVTKDIYVHVAPEEHQSSVQEHHTYHQPPRKHYRIVFIKAPSPDISKAVVKQAPTEDKTIIYVLTKKQDPIDLKEALKSASSSKASKPEVYFIKYKTQEEAENAQRLIKAEYDKLGGTTHVSDETIAPVTSVIGSTGHSSSSSGHSSHKHSSHSLVEETLDKGDSKGYLPPSYE